MVVACLPYPAMASPTGSVRVPVPWVVRGLWSRREESTRRSPSTSSPDGGGFSDAAVYCSASAVREGEEGFRTKEKLMGIKKVWEIEHSCGHVAERDLSERAPDKRAGFAKWLAGTDCFDCYKKKNDGDFEKKRRAEQQEALSEAAVYEKRSGLEELSGSDKQIVWARQIRVQVLGSLYEEVEAGKQDESWFEETVLKPARLIATSRWWIDNKEFEVEDWPELLASGAESAEANENLVS